MDGKGDRELTHMSIPQKVLRVAAYERVSTDEQAKHGLSIGAQTEALDSWIREHGHILIGHYTDAGISGGKAIEKRPAMAQLLRDVQDGQVDLIVFTKLDRWFRSLKNYYIAQDVLDQHHCAWQAIHEDYETLSSTGRFKVNIMLSVAQQERERTSERIQSVFDYMKAQGRYTTGGQATPYGYKVENHHLVFDPETEQDVRRFFDLVLSGMSPGSAIRQMQDTSSHPLRYVTYRRMMYKPIYAGIHNGIHGFCPAYITEEQHKSLAATAGTRTPYSGYVYLFTGLLRCPVCGGSMVCRRHEAKGIMYTYYSCAIHLSERQCTFRDHLREERIETALTAFLFEGAQIVIDSARAATATKSSRQNSAQIESKMKRLAETYTDGVIDRETYKKRLSDLRAQLDESQSTPTSSTVPPLEVAQQFIQGNMQSVYTGLSRTEKRLFWTNIIQSATIDADYQIQNVIFL